MLPFNDVFLQLYILYPRPDGTESKVKLSCPSKKEMAQSEIHVTQEVTLTNELFIAHGTDFQCFLGCVMKVVGESKAVPARQALGISQRKIG